MRVGDLVAYVGPPIPGIFHNDMTREPNYGVLVEAPEPCQGTCFCVFWPEAEEYFWHEETDLSVLCDTR
jgi:hypothetical protein